MRRFPFLPHLEMTMAVPTRAEHRSERSYAPSDCRYWGGPVASLTRAARLMPVSSR
jgi:hypothetical protein